MRPENRAVNGFQMPSHVYIRPQDPPMKHYRIYFKYIYFYCPRAKFFTFLFNHKSSPCETECFQNQRQATQKLSFFPLSFIPNIHTYTHIHTKQRRNKKQTKKIEKKERKKRNRVYVWHIPYPFLG